MGERGKGRREARTYHYNSFFMLVLTHFLSTFTPALSSPSSLVSGSRPIAIKTCWIHPSWSQLVSLVHCYYDN